MMDLILIALFCGNFLRGLGEGLMLDNWNFSIVA